MAHVSQHALGNFINSLLSEHIVSDENGNYEFDVAADCVSRHTYLMSCDMLTQYVDSYATLLDSLNDSGANSFRRDIRGLNDGVAEKYGKCRPEIDKNGGDARLFSTDYDIVILTFKVPVSRSDDSKETAYDIDVSNNNAIDGSANGTRAASAKPEILAVTFDMDDNGCATLSRCLSTVLCKDVNISIGNRCNVVEALIERMVQWLAAVRFDLTTCCRVSYAALLFSLVYSSVNGTVDSGVIPILSLALISSACISARRFIRQYTDIPNVFSLMLRISDNSDIRFGTPSRQICMSKHFVNAYRFGMAWRITILVACLVAMITVILRQA